MKMRLISLSLLLAASCGARADDLPVLAPHSIFSRRTTKSASAIDDPAVTGVACYISQARKGGWGQPFGLNEDPSNFSVSCRQVGQPRSTSRSCRIKRRPSARRLLSFSNERKSTVFPTRSATSSSMSP